MAGQTGGRRGFLRLAALVAVSSAAAGVGGFLAGAAQRPPQPAVATRTVTVKPTPGIERIKVGYIPIMDSLPLFVGIERGLFAESGLEVEAQIVRGSGVTVEALLTQGIDIGLIALPAVFILAEKRGVFLKLLHPSEWLGNLGIRRVYDEAAVVVRVGSGIGRVADLEGRTFAINALGSPSHVAAVLIAKRAGVDPGRIAFKELPFPKMPVALERGEVDAMVGVQPFLSFVISKGVGRKLIDPPLIPEHGNYFVAAYGDPMIVSGWWSTEEFLSERADAARRFVRAFADAVAWYRANPGEAQSIAARWTKLDPDLVATLFEASVFHGAYPHGFADFQFMRPQMEAFLEAGFLEGPLDLGRFVETPWFKPEAPPAAPALLSGSSTREG